jgi:hypothetical protein
MAWMDVRMYILKIRIKIFSKYREISHTTISPRSANFIVRVYITEYNNELFENGMTITPFPASPTQMSDLRTFLVGIYDEFRRLKLYESTLLIYLQRRRERKESAEYDYAEETPEDHLFREGPLPSDFTFNILERDIREGRVRRGYQVWLADVCQGNNIWNGWRVVLELI